MIEDQVMELLHRVRSLDRRPVQITPATDEDLQRFEQIHGIRLPKELKSWFRRCDGANVNPGGLESLFPKNQPISLDWHFRQYPAWKERGWFPVASDGCGDLYVMTARTIIPSTGTHPVCFLDQSDFTKPRYAVASGVWKFLYLLLQTEVLRDEEREDYWPFSKEFVLAADPALAECKDVPLPWGMDGE